MSDTYQAVYDAVRSRLFNCDVGQAIRDGMSVDASSAIATISWEFSAAANEQRRPFVLLRPRMFPDGNQWCALYGDNLQEGVAGFGDTPEKAAIAFDLAWLNERAGK